MNSQWQTGKNKGWREGAKEGMRNVGMSADSHGVRRRRRERNYAPYVAMPVQDEACNVAGPWTANIHG